MGFFGKIMGAVTGGSATVTIEFHPHTAFPGEMLGVRVTATSKGNPVKGDGVYVDVRGVEEIRLRKSESENLTDDVSLSRTTLEQSFQIAGPFQMDANQTQHWEGQIQLPPNAQPTFDGSICDHDWGIRGRLSTFGNDPDSGFGRMRVGLKS